MRGFSRPPMYSNRKLNGLLSVIHNVNQNARIFQEYPGTLPVQNPFRDDAPKHIYAHPEQSASWPGSSDSTRNGFPSWDSTVVPAQRNHARTQVDDPGTPPPARIPEPPTTITPGNFRPMTAIGGSNHRRPGHVRGDGTADPASFSINYRGEHNSRNASSRDLAPELNCALWITKLPADVTHHELLSSIRNIGRIWCAVINEPDFERHLTAAAKVVFFSPESAQLLLDFSLSKGLVIRGLQAKVTHNRVKNGAQSSVGNVSRVLIITGKSSFVNETSLTAFFESKFVFQMDEVVPLITNVSGRSVIEYKFGSYRCQAQMGKMALEKDEPEGFEKVEFGPDPCEVGDTLASYGIAGERIQGL